jgi:hypothetical protein
MMSRDIVSLGALSDKSWELATGFHRRSVVDNQNHVVGKSKRRSISVDDSRDLLIVAECLVEVNMEHVAATREHNVVIVSISEAEDVSSDGISGTRSREIVDQLEFVVSLASKPVVKAALFLVVANLHLPRND